MAAAAPAAPHAVPPAEARPFTDLFDVGALLGSGSFGSVHVGTDLVRSRATGVQHRVALKYLSIRRNATREQLLEEIRILHVLCASPVHHSPRLLAWYDQPEEHPPRIVLVTELARGGELFRCIAAGMFSEDMARRVLIAVCEELREMHALGIVHRDIKFDNILVLEPLTNIAGLLKPPADATYLLADMGMAWDMRTPDTRAQSHIFTRGWRAREVLGVPHASSPASDVWAVGILLFILLTQRFPYTDDRVVAPDGSQSVDESPVLARAEPRWALIERRGAGVARLIPLLRRMLSHDPTVRPTAEQILADAWVRDVGAGAEDEISHIPAGDIPFQATRTATLVGLARTAVTDERFNALRAHFQAGGSQTFDIPNEALRAALVQELGFSAELATELLSHSALYEVLDADHSGLIDWRELLVLLPLLSEGAPAQLSDLPRSTLRLLFLAFDNDHDGRLSLPEARALFRIAHATIPPASAHAANIIYQLLHGLQFLDPTGDRRVREFIDLETFVDAVRGGGVALQGA